MAWLDGWQRRVVDGGLLLIAPDFRMGTIRVRTAVPLRPAKAIVADVVQEKLLGAAFALRAPPRRFATEEGEYAAIFELAAQPPGMAEVRRTIAVVACDRDAAVIDGRAFRPEGYDITVKVEALTAALRLGLGSDRRRRYFYTPPAGWHREARLQADVWYAPDYPRNSSVITVFHARPLEPRLPHADHADLFENLPAEWGRQPAQAHEAVQTGSGLTGEMAAFQVEHEGRVLVACNVGLGDSQTLYMLRLQAAREDLAATLPHFHQVVASVQALPRPRETEDAMSQWSE